MNKRIEELAIQAGLESVSDNLFYAYNENLEHFAALVRQDEAQACAKHYLDIMRDAVEQAVLREREACAKLCDVTFEGDECLTAVINSYADDIRARGEKIKDEDDDIQEYKKPWIGLTDEEIEVIAKKLMSDKTYCSLHFAVAIQAKLKEKNT